jgi:UTP:GlnB (protein PII) uridylyltransferase
MPSLYFERTSVAEQARHRDKLAQLPSGGGLLIDPVPQPDGGWAVEIVTMDWDEPGLLDKIFEAILRCINIPEGIFVHHARIFTGNGGQVVNILDLQTRAGKPLTRESCDLVLEQLRQVRRAERGVLETIQHFPFPSPVPLLADFPSLDNGRSERYTYLELNVTRISNRFTSVLLHFLARSELWLNIQVAEFRQDREGRYAFWVVDKNGRKLKDSHFVRLGMVRTLEAMNRMLMQFNLYYIRRNWQQRIERNESTIYHSRPDPENFLQDLGDLRQLAELKGFETRLSHLVERGLLDSPSYYLLKKAEAFVQRNRTAIRAMVESGPSPEQIELCREYFELRRRTLRILVPVFQQLLEIPPLRSSLSDEQRLHALCRPYSSGRFALDAGYRLYITGPVWLGEPSTALDPLLLLARTDCHVREDTLDSVEAALESWTDYYIEEHRGEFGHKFMALLDETLRQGNTALVLRTLRSVGLLQRFIPHFKSVQGLIHVVADHSYTVDEHSFVLIEVLSGLKLLADVFPDSGRPGMASDYERLRESGALQNYVRKYATELRMLARVTELRSNPAIRAFFQFMDEVRNNTLEYTVELNLLEHGYTTCMIALSEIVKVRRQLESLIRVMTKLTFTEQRDLMLTGLLHDIRKPAVNHPELGAQDLDEILSGMGLSLPDASVRHIRWLIRHHLDVRPLMNRMGAEEDGALREYAQQVGDPALLRMLILFTYADRVAVHLDPNKNSHDAMLLTEMLSQLGEMEGK